MALTVLWSRRAISDVEAIADYLEANWTEKEIRSFFQKIGEADLANFRKTLVISIFSKP